MIANRVGGLWKQIGTIGYESISTPLAWMGIFSFAFQIYFDFPYLSKTMTEFWKKWHITLGNWFKEYIYIPLSGNRKRQVRNLFVVWLVTGMWHGANWNFILWGMFCFLLILMGKKGLGKYYRVWVDWILENAIFI